MINKKAKMLKNEDIKYLPVDPELRRKIEDLSKSMDASVTGVVNVAIRMLEEAMGRDVIIEDTDKNLEIKIDAFKKYNKKVDL